MTLLPVKLDDLIHARTVESVRVEFKATWSDPIRDAVIRTISAFANDFQGLNGGYVVLGIEENGGAPILPPRGLDGLDLERIQREILGNCDRISPTYKPLVAPEIYMDRQILVIYAPIGDARPYQAPERHGKADRRYYVRIGPETKVAKDAVLTQLLHVSARLPFDERRQPGVPLAVVSPRLVSRYLVEAGSDLATAATLDVPDVLRRLRLSAGTNGGEAPKNAALLCFTEEPETWFPSARIDLAQFRDDHGGDLIETRSFRGPLQLQVLQLLEFLDGLFGEVVRKVPGEVKAERFVAFPQGALREAVVNAVYHRSYEGVHPPPRIGLYPDRVEITSYPGPVAGLERVHLAPDARPPQLPPRNPRIGDLLKAIRLAETWHTGVPKIHRVMRENGSPAPIFDFDEARTYFRVTLPAHPGYVVLHALREAATLWHTGEQARAIEQLQQARERVPQSGALAAQAIAYLTSIGDLASARKVLMDLEQTGGASDRHLAYMALARAYLDADDRDAASALLANIPPAGSADQQIALAILHKRSRRFQDAHRLFAAVSEQTRNDPKALHEWAQTKLKLARPPSPADVQRQLRREAVDLLERVVRLSGDQKLRAAWAWFDLAQARAGLGEPDASVTDALDRAIALDPGEERFRQWKQQRASDGA
jgi:ATP-dependent DNA helicase RecG